MGRIRILSVWLACVAGGSVMATGDLKDDAVKKDLEKLQGIWAWRATEVEGKENNSERAQAIAGNAVHTVKGDKWRTEMVIFGMRGSYSGTIKIDPTSTPKKIDFIYDKSGPNAGKTMLGIYAVEGDNLRLEWGEVGKDERPKALTTKKGDQFQVNLFKRRK